MKTMSGDVPLSTATTLSSVGAFVIGFIKETDWVMVASVLIPLTVGVLNLIYRHREAQRSARIQTLQIQQGEQAVKHQQALFDQQFELAQRNADRKLELELDIAQRTVQLQKQKIDALTQIANELHLTSEEDKRILLNTLMEQTSYGDSEKQPNNK